MLIEQLNDVLIPCSTTGIEIGQKSRYADAFPWHTGTPTEEGWYLVAFNYEFEEGVRYTTDYFKDGKWAFPMVRDISKISAWQKITPFEASKENI